MRRVLLLLLPLLLLALPSSAEEAAPPPASPAATVENGEVEIEEWRQRLLEGHERLESARARALEAKYAHRDGRQRRRRGAEKAQLTVALEAAEKELAAAEAEFPVLLEQARRAGVPPGVLREFED